MSETKERFERLPSVMGRTGWSRSSIYAGMKDGTFPKPIKLGPRAIAWPSSVIDEWMASRIKAAA